MNRKPLTLALAFAVSAVACNSVFGISDAAVDPTFGEATGGTGNAAGTTAGTAGIAGSAGGTSAGTAGTAGASGSAAGASGASAGTGGVAGAGAAGAAGAGGGVKTRCDVYCEAITTNCTGTNLEYSGLTSCKEICSKFDPGQMGNTTGDSLECRITYALKAQQAPAANCRPAGITGYTSCQTEPCIPFCLIATSLCKGKTMPPTEYPNESACFAACQGKFPFLLDKGDQELSGGPTLNCRLYHVDAAYSDLPGSSDTHCDHTYPKSVPCGDLSGSAGASGTGGTGGTSGSGGLSGAAGVSGAAGLSGAAGKAGLGFPQVTCDAKRYRL